MATFPVKSKCQWTERQKSNAGRIIFADFLEQPLHKYINIIEEAEKELYSKGDDSIVSAGCLSEESASDTGKNRLATVIAEIIINGNDLCIKYVDDVFNRIYTVNEKLSSPLHYKLKRISSRNELTHRILEGIIEHQKFFLFTGNSAELEPLSQVMLVNCLKKDMSDQIDYSWVSRLVSKISVITPFGEEKVLKSLFPTRKDINYKLVKLLFIKEREELESGKLNKPLADNHMKARLEKEYGVSISRWSISQYRKSMGILEAKRRLSEYRYPPLLSGFSKFYDLVPSEITKYTTLCPAVYEFSLKFHEIDYPDGKSYVFYIGSTKNIRKRLREHLKENTKNRIIKYYLKNYVCSFRYVPLVNSWMEQEYLLYNLFVSSYGAKPICNRIRPPASA